MDVLRIDLSRHLVLVPVSTIVSLQNTTSERNVFKLGKNIECSRKSNWLSTERGMSRQIALRQGSDGIPFEENACWNVSK